MQLGGRHHFSELNPDYMEDSDSATCLLCPSAMIGMKGGGSSLVFKILALVFGPRAKPFPSQCEAASSCPFLRNDIKVKAGDVSFLNKTVMD